MKPDRSPGSGPATPPEVRAKKAMLHPRHAALGVVAVLVILILSFAPRLSDPRLAQEDLTPAPPPPPPITNQVATPAP